MDWNNHYETKEITDKVCKRSKIVRRKLTVNDTADLVKILLRAQNY